MKDRLYYGGYLETMFGGAGAEVLYRPLDSNWAFGLDLVTQGIEWQEVTL